MNGRFCRRGVHTRRGILPQHGEHNQRHNKRHLYRSIEPHNTREPSKIRDVNFSAPAARAPISG